MNDAVEKAKRFRSPPYPMFDLRKAVERATELHAKASAHSVGVQVLAEAWGMKSVDGKVWRTAASLIQYGLLQDFGTGKTRKFQITDSAKRIILDANPDSERRHEMIQKAALNPMIHAELWGIYGAAKGLSDTAIKTHLTIDREEGGEAPYSPSAADEVIATYRSTLAYAGLGDSAKVSLQQEDTAEKDNADLSQKSPKNAKVGDFVRWESGGVVQFDSRKVDWVSEDGTHLRVFGSPTGIPMDQIEKVPPPAAAVVATPKERPKSEAETEGKLNATAYVENGRLKLTADVGLEEIDDLRQMLEGYKAILKFLN
jgi:hypothetical protein